MKKILMLGLIFLGSTVYAQTLQQRRAAAKQKVSNTASAAKAKASDTKVGEKVVSVAANRPKPIETVKELADYVQNEFAEMKNDRVGILEQYNNFKDKTGFLTGDFFSPDILDNLKEGMGDIKEKITAETAAIKSFAGADRKGGRGTECYKFKNDITGLINSIESLKSSLMGDIGGKANVNDKLGELIQKLPPASVYPMYRIMGSMLSALNQKATDLSKSVKYLVDARNDMAMIPPSSIKNTSYIRTGGPSAEQNAANDNLAPANQLSIDRDKVAKAITIVRDTKPVWIFVSKMLQESKETDVAIGGSFFGHLEFHLKMNPGKKFGLIMEAVTEQVDQLLDHWSNNLDQLDKNDLTATLKRIEDNQNKILQKLGQ